MEKLQNLFSLTPSGAKHLFRACLVSFFGFCAQMLPMFFFMFYLQGGLVIVLVLYSIIYLDYNATYTTTYKESANIRTDIAESLQSLPLSYFSSHDLSDLSQTIMSDVERLEHALSHAISKTIGFVFFFVLASLMMLLGNPIMGLCIILPLLFIAAMIGYLRSCPSGLRAVTGSSCGTIQRVFRRRLSYRRRLRLTILVHR